MPSLPISLIEVFNPFFEGATNVYLFPDHPVTIVDTGADTPPGLKDVETGLAERGLRVEDLEQIVLTHKHPDHFGLAKRLVDRSGARVFAHVDDLDYVTRYDEGADDYYALIERMLTHWGAPPEKIATVPKVHSSKFVIAQSVDAHGLREGERIRCGAVEFEIIHTPGHTRGCICLLGDGYLLTGDHLLPDCTPNIGGGEVGVEGLLTMYLQSLEKILRLPDDLGRVLPGHGEPIVDAKARANETIQHHRNRDAEFLRLLHEQQPITVYDLATEMFGDLKGYHVVLGAAETQAHLERLEIQGKVQSELGQFRLA